ncbi:MAG: glycosyltransferase [Syntrophaceae bacterium]|nr:glycosyltransferase [Syntrophaceae bacterium]
MKKRLSITILGTLPPVRALSSYCFELACALLENCNIEFLSFKSIYPAFLYPGGRPDGDDTYPNLDMPGLLVKRNLAWYNPFSWLYEGLLSKGELLHAQWWSMPLFPIYFTVCGCFKLRKKPVLFTVHNVLSHEKSAIYVALSRLLFTLGDRFIVHSALNKQQLLELYKIPPDRVSVVPHGSLDFHVRPGIDRDSLRKERGLSSQSKVVLLFGAIRPYKGIDTAIRAFSKAAKQIPDARLLIAGRLWEDWAPYEKIIRDLQIADRVITHLDYIPSGNVHAFFEVADLCVFPYHHFDSQSGAGAVALSFRKPMIVSDVGGLPELVNDRQFVVPAADAEALAQAMIRCLGDPAVLASMASDAEKVAGRFAWPGIAEKTKAIYEQLVSVG